MAAPESCQRWLRQGAPPTPGRSARTRIGLASESPVLRRRWSRAVELRGCCTLCPLGPGQSARTASWLDNIALLRPQCRPPFATDIFGVPMSTDIFAVPRHPNPLALTPFALPVRLPVLRSALRQPNSHYGRSARKGLRAKPVKFRHCPATVSGTASWSIPRVRSPASVACRRLRGKAEHVAMSDVPLQENLRQGSFVVIRGARSPLPFPHQYGKDITP